MATAAVFALFASLAGYIIISINDARQLTNSAGFFHDAGKPWRAVVSLTAFSITLGTGVAYVLSQAKTTGIFIYLTPFGVGAGYLAIAYFYRHLAFKAGERAPNLFFLLGEEGADGRYRLSAFGRFFGLFMALTYVLVLGYELEVGSEIIVNSLLADPTPAAHIGFALLIYLVVVVYTALGGLRSAVSTDVFQIGLVFLFFAALLYVLWGYEPPSSASATEAADQNMTLAVSSAVLALIMAVTTQFYSIVNSNMGSGYPPEDQLRIFRWVGFWGFVVYAGVATLGLHLGSPEGLSHVIHWYISADPGGNPIPVAVTVCLFAGMLAILMSTLDNMTIAVTQIVSQNAFRLNPFSEERTAGQGLHRLRIAHALVSFAVLAFMLLCVHLFDNPFSLLLTILFAATVMSPLTAAAVWISAHGGRSLMHRPVVAWAIFGGTCIAWGWYFVLTNQSARQESVWLHLGAFGLALSISIIDLLQARRGRSGAVNRGGTNGEGGALPKEVV